MITEFLSLFQIIIFNLNLKLRFLLEEKNNLASPGFYGNNPIMAIYKAGGWYNLVLESDWIRAMGLFRSSITAAGSLSFMRQCFIAFTCDNLVYGFYVSSFFCLVNYIQSWVTLLPNLPPSSALWCKQCIAVERLQLLGLSRVQCTQKRSIEKA